MLLLWRDLHKHRPHSLCLLIVCLLWGSMPALSAQQQRPAFHYQYPFRSQHHFFQNDTLPNARRKAWINGLAIAGFGGTMLYMGTVWYSQQELSGFHFFDDAHEWKQMDKVGHALGGYQFSRMMIDLYKWSGAPKKKALVGGGLSAFLAMSSLELLDAFGKTWGFSWSDVGANFAGSALAVGNEWLWHEDRVQLKFSYRRSAYTRNPDFDRLFGSTYPEWLLKDYNGQTYWLSFRVHSFLPESRFKDHFPRWLNLAVGYGAEGLEGGYDDPNQGWRDREYRQWYLSLDLDLSQIRTRNGFLKRLLSTLNFVRIPLPSLRLDRNGLSFRAWE